MRNFFIAFVLLPTINCLYANEALRITYHGEPIQLQLQLGHEQRIVLISEPSVKVGIPEFLSGKLSVTTIGSQVWLLAEQSFESEKIIFKTPATEMVLEISASRNYTSGEPIFLSTEMDTALSDAAAIDKSCDIGMVALVRYALQWAYSPRRLLRHNPCIRAINYPKDLIDIMSCLRTNGAVCGGGVVAGPIAAWRTTKFYASLLEIKNTLQTSIPLDPRAIAGDFKAAALAHHILGAADSAQSVTALVVISDKPLSRSISKERWLDKASTVDHPQTP